MVKMPEAALPRNIDLNEALTKPSMANADKFGLQTIGRGAFLPENCDEFGNVRPVDIMGRVSDSVQHLSAAWPDLTFDGQHEMSGALLEARIIHRNRPVSGNSYVIRSGLRAANPYVREICHWILDPVSGQCWSSMIGVPCKFDLKNRRLVKNDEKTLKLLKKNLIKGLGI